MPELESLGHSAVAIDLPGAGERLSETATLAAWPGPLRAVIDDGDVLVGHSMGGFAISLVADDVPDKVARLIYLSAAVPVDGQPMGLQSSAADWAATVGMPYEDFVEVVELPNQGPCMRLTEPTAANMLFFHDCTTEDQAWAWVHLTSLPLGPANETFHLPNFATAPIPP